MNNFNAEKTVRDIVLEGVANFRDIGGYPTGLGQSVRWGKLYRAAEPTALTPQDRKTLDALNLRTMYDLRTTGERAKRPCSTWESGGPARLHRDYGRSGADLPSIVHDRTVTAAKLRQMMLDAYGTMPVEQADGFRDILATIAAGHVPLVFHCAAGKDRTGIFAAIVLDLLGVSRKDITVDYLLTNRGIDRARVRFLRYARRDDLDPAIWDPLLQVEPDYLGRMFQVIDERHGGTKAYVESLGITVEQIQNIRTYLLETET